MNRCARVEPRLVFFPNTFISTKTRYTVQIYNDRPEEIHYEWRFSASDAQDAEVMTNYDLDDSAQRKEFDVAVKFKSEIFHFDKLSGKINANRFVQALVAFTPDLSVEYCETAYLYVIETGERIGMQMRGTGLAPEARFTVQSVGVGHVMLESVFDYQIELKNTGETPVDFTFEEKETPGLIFEFSPAHAVIPIGGTMPIMVHFVANSVCTFSEWFTCKVRGATSGHPTVLFFGKVLGPLYNLSVKSLDFATVSYSFLYTKTFEIENKSEIAFDYAFNFLHDGSFVRREFSCKPCAGTIQKFSKQQILVEFLPATVQKYKVQLCLDIEKFGKKLSIIPISATCIAPAVQITLANIDMGDVFIGHPVKARLPLINDTDHPAKFEYIQSNDKSQLEARTTVKKPAGIIPQREAVSLTLLVTPMQLGPMKVMHYVRIHGWDGPPTLFTVSGICVGPSVTLSRKEIAFGRIQVLRDIRQVVNIVNTSPIPGPFKTKIEDDGHVFRCENDEGEIQGGESLPISIVARLTDPKTFKGRLTIFVRYLNPLVIPLSAFGLGTSIVSSIDMENINLKHIFSEVPVVTKFELHNQGKQSQELRWSMQKPHIVTGQQGTIMTAKIVPETMTLQPDEKSEFNLIVQCPKPCSFEVAGQCASSMGRKRVDIFKPTVKGIFIRPVVSLTKV